MSINFHRRHRHTHWIFPDELTHGDDRSSPLPSPARPSPLLFTFAAKNRTFQVFSIVLLPLARFGFCLLSLSFQNVALSRRQCIPLAQIIASEWDFSPIRQCRPARCRSSRWKMLGTRLDGLNKIELHRDWPSLFVGTVFSTGKHFAILPHRSGDVFDISAASIVRFAVGFDRTLRRHDETLLQDDRRSIVDVNRSNRSKTVFARTANTNYDGYLRQTRALYRRMKRENGRTQEKLLSCIINLAGCSGNRKTIETSRE